MNGNRSSVSLFLGDLIIPSNRVDRIANHNSMVTKFAAAMSKLAVIGHNPRDLVDCSEVIPIPSKAKIQNAKLPAGKTLRDIEAAVRLLSNNELGSMVFLLLKLLLHSAAPHHSPSSLLTPALPQLSRLCKLPTPSLGHL